MKILYLYHDLMNLYGDNGNMRTMQRHLSDQGFNVTVETKTVGDDIDFSEYAFIYCGSGTERNRNAALAHFKQFAGGFKAAVEKGTVALFTGNSLEMLGERLESIDGKAYEGLGVLPFHVKEHPDRRYTGDVIFVCDMLESPVVGFVNKCSELSVIPVENALFHVEMGMGNAEEDKLEGVHVGNLFGTYVTGPVCVKNPHVLKHLINLIGEQERTGFVYADENSGYEKLSYEVTLKALRNRLASEKG